MTPTTPITTKADIGTLIQARSLITHGLAVNANCHEDYMRSFRGMVAQAERMYRDWLKHTGKAPVMPEDATRNDADTDPGYSCYVVSDTQLAEPARSEQTNVVDFGQYSGNACPHGILKGQPCDECEMAGTPNDSE